MPLLRTGLPKSPSEQYASDLIKKNRILAGRISQFSSASSKLHRDGLQNFADNATAILGGLKAGDIYYTNSGGSAVLKIVI